MTQFDLQTKGFKELSALGELPFEPCLVMFAHPTADKITATVKDYYDNTSEDVVFRTAFPYALKFKSITELSENAKVYMLFNIHN